MHAQAITLTGVCRVCRWRKLYSLSLCYWPRRIS